MSDDFETLFLKIAEREICVGDDEPSRFTHFPGGAVHKSLDDDLASVEIGTFAAIHIDAVGAVAQGESIFDVFDSHAATVGYFENLYDLDTCDFKPAIVKAACGDDYLWSPDLPPGTGPPGDLSRVSRQVRGLFVLRARGRCQGSRYQGRYMRSGYRVVSGKSSSSAGPKSNSICATLIGSILPKSS